MKPKPTCRRPAATLVLLSLVIIGCAGNQAIQRADEEMARGNLDTAIAHYQEILLQDPDNTEARIKLAYAKADASQMHEAEGKRLLEAGRYDAAISELQLAIRLDPANELALQELGRAQEQRALALRAEAENLTPTELAIRDAAQAPPVVPQLDPQTTGPVTFDFRDAAIREIYQTVAQVAGLNVLFEPMLQADQVTSFQIQNTDFDEALRMLTTANGHFIKVLSPSTFMVVQDDVTKRREYDDQVMRTFYLSNADAATVEQQVRAILTTQLVSSNPDLNTITVRDTPQAIGVVERLIAAADKAVGEILLEVEILEVSSEVVANYGLALEPFGGRMQVYPQTVDEATGAVLGRSLDSLGSLTSADLFITVPSLFYQFLRTTTDFKLVAQPKLRAREGQETTLLIGEEVPIVTTTFNPQSTVGGNVVPISSTEYRDTGILMSVLPRVHFNGEITLEIAIQVSAVTSTATIQSIGELPIFTTREVQGSVRLKDGETNIIAGLLQDNDIRRRRGIIGLDNVPGLGDALSDTEATQDQNDIVISITPHLLRTAEITAEDLRPVYVGTQTAVTGGIFAGGAGAAAGIRPGQPQAAGAGGETQTQAATMALLPAEHVVTVGEEFALDVTVDSAAEVGSAGFQLTFNPQQVAYVDYFEGGFLDRDGAEISMQATAGGPGVVRIGAARIGTEQGISGGGSLVTLVMRAVAPGTSQIEITGAALRAPRGAPIAVQYTPATVTVREQR